MKKTLFIISTLVATLCACGGTKKNSVVSTADESKVEQVTDTCNTEQDIAVIQTFYEKCVCSVLHPLMISMLPSMSLLT